MTVIVRLMGGLGNQLFQYAAGRALATRLGAELKLDKLDLEVPDALRGYELCHFNVREQFEAKDVLAKVRPGPRCVPDRSKLRTIWRRLVRRSKQQCFTRIDEQRPSAFDPRFLHLQGNLYLNGYWQSEKYFLPIRPELLQEFSLRDGCDQQNQRFQKLIARQSNSISLHVRRTDYISNERTRAIHDVCTPAYYHRCIESIRRRVGSPHFFVFSDDIPWARSNLCFEEPVTFVDHNGPDRGHQDLLLMSRCRHHILANSSFSWWGAWLDARPEKLVLAPARWFREDVFEAPDICPPTWERLAVD